MFSFSPPSQASPSAQSSLQATAAWGEMDEVTLGCECADPALQIAMWSQESFDSVQPAASAS